MDQIISNRGGWFSEHIGDDSIQSNITDSKSILKAVFFTSLTRCKFKTVACVFPEDTDFFGRDKTSVNQSETEQVANPFGILCIIFIAFYGFDPFGIGNGYTDTVFQKIENRYPILTGRFHTDVKTVIVEQPLFETADVRIEGWKTLFVVRGLDTFRGFNDCGNEKFLMDIDATAGVVNNFHGFITPFVQNRRSHWLLCHTFNES